MICYILILISLFTGVNAIQLIVHRKEDKDYLENASSALCQQYVNTNWNDLLNRCECSDKSTFFSITNKTLGCYSENEAGCTLHLASSPNSIQFADVTSPTIVPFGPFSDPNQIAGCRRPTVQVWSIDAWADASHVASKLKQTKFVVSFQTADYTSEVQGRLFKALFTCVSDIKCLLFKVDGSSSVKKLEPTPVPTQPVVTNEKIEGNGDDTSETLVIVLAVILTMIVVVALVTGGLIFYRRSRNKRSDSITDKGGSRRKSQKGDDENIYEDIGDGLYSDIGEGSTYLDPIETMKRVSVPTVSDPYTVMRDRESFATNTFNINQPTPPVPHHLMVNKPNNKNNNNNINLYIPPENERYSSLDPSATIGNTNEGYLTLSDTSSMRYVAPGFIEGPQEHKQHPDELYDCVSDEERNGDEDGEYDVVDHPQNTGVYDMAV